MTYIQQNILNKLNSISRSCWNNEDRKVASFLGKFNKESVNNDEYYNEVLKINYSPFQEDINKCLIGIRKFSEEVSNASEEYKEVALDLMFKFIPKAFGEDPTSLYSKAETMKFLQKLEAAKGDLEVIKATLLEEGEKPNNPVNTHFSDIQDRVDHYLGMSGQQEGDISLEDLLA